MSQITKATFSFLKDIKQNNNREWFLENKPLYLNVKAELEGFADDLLHGLMSFDEGLRDEPKPHVFRIYRDARFAKGRPYKNNLGILCAQGGRRNMHERAGYYFHIEPGGCFLAGGIYMPPTSWLNAVRDDIVENAKPFKSILQKPAFEKHFSFEGSKLKTAPKGYPKDHPEIELLRYKSLLAMHYFKDREVMSAAFLEELIAMCKVMQPFNAYLNQFI